MINKDGVFGPTEEEVKEKFDAVIKELGFDGFIALAVNALMVQHKFGNKTYNLNEINKELAINFYETTPKLLWYYFMFAEQHVIGCEWLLLEEE